MNYSVIIFLLFSLVSCAFSLSPLPPGDNDMNYECNCCMFMVPILNYYWQLNPSVNLTSLAANISAVGHIGYGSGTKLPSYSRTSLPCNAYTMQIMFGTGAQTGSQTNFTSQLATLFAQNQTAFDICSALNLKLCGPALIPPLQLTCSQCDNITQTWNKDNDFPWFGTCPGCYAYIDDAPQWNVGDICGFGGALWANRLAYFNNDRATCIQYFAVYFTEFWQYAWGTYGGRTGCPPTVPCTP